MIPSQGLRKGSIAASQELRKSTAGNFKEESPENGLQKLDGLSIMSF